MKKFVSKNSNYRVVLRNAIPSEPITGRNAVPGLYVKFEGGIAKVDEEKNPELFRLMTNHIAFNRDYILVDDGSVDPYKDQHQNTEPKHDISEVEYGRVGKKMGDKPTVILTPELKEIVTKMATEVAKEMIKKMLKEAKKKEESDDNKKEEIKE